MKKNQEFALQAKPYQKFLEESINNIINSIDKNSLSFFNKNKNSSDKTLIILISTNKGLCGGFNINLIRHLIKTQNYKNTQILTLGKKGAVMANSVGFKIIADFSSNNLLENVSAVFNYALKQYKEGYFNKVLVTYNIFESIIKYVPTTEKLLPFEYTPTDNKQEIKGFVKTYTIEPEP